MISRTTASTRRRRRRRRFRPRSCVRAPSPSSSAMETLPVSPVIVAKRTNRVPARFRRGEDDDEVRTIDDFAGVSLALARLQPASAHNTTATNQAPRRAGNRADAMPPRARSANAAPTSAPPDDRTPLDGAQGADRSEERRSRRPGRPALWRADRARPLDEAWKLWANADAAKAFDRNWRDDSEVHLEIGKPGDTEGAAGSIYMTDPGRLLRQDQSGGDFRRAGRRDPAPGQRRARLDRGAAPLAHRADRLEDRPRSCSAPRRTASLRRA